MSIRLFLFVFAVCMKLCVQVSNVREVSGVCESESERLRMRVSVRVSVRASV